MNEGPPYSSGRLSLRLHTDPDHHRAGPLRRPHLPLPSKNANQILRPPGGSD